MSLFLLNREFWGIGPETARIAEFRGMRIGVPSRAPLKRRDDLNSVSRTEGLGGMLRDRAFLHGQTQEFLSGLDYHLLAMPLTPDTKGFFGTDEHAAFSSSAGTLNPTCGPLIDEQALVEALWNR